MILRRKDRTKRQLYPRISTGTKYLLSQFPDDCTGNRGHFNRKNAGLKRMRKDNRKRISDLTLRDKQLETKDNRSHRNRTTKEERVDYCAGL